MGFHILKMPPQSSSVFLKNFCILCCPTMLTLVEYKVLSVRQFLTKVMTTRVSSKQTKKFFGSNRNKPKHNLFRLIFGLFRETKNLFFRFVSVCFGVSDTLRNNRNKQICFETNRNKQKKLKFAEKINILNCVESQSDRKVNLTT
jgi:hypothetical protein